jgi:hypothetical protein
MMSFPTLSEGIARGRLMLKTYTQQDFGYDPKAWHDHLAETKRYYFRSRSRPGVYPQDVLSVLENPDWIDAVRTAESTLLMEQIQKEQRDMRDAIDRAEREWSGKLRKCPKCQATFKSVGDRGQCPPCRHLFYASHPAGDPEWWRTPMNKADQFIEREPP